MSFVNRIGLAVYLLALFLVGMSILGAVGAQLSGWREAAVAICVVAGPFMILVGSDE